MNNFMKIVRYSISVFVFAHQNLSNQRFFRPRSCVGIYLNKCKRLTFLPKFPFQTNYLTNDIIRSDSQRYFCSK